MSTPSNPDEPTASSDTPGSGGARTSTEEPAPEAQRGPGDGDGETQRNGARDVESTTRVQAVEDGGPAGSSRDEGADDAEPDAVAASDSTSGGGSAGPPPPWQRGGAATGPPSGPIPAAGRPSPRPTAPPNPTGGQRGPGGPGAHPPSGPFPRPVGPLGVPGRPPSEGAAPSSGGVPLASRTAPVTGAAAPGGTAEPGASSASGTSSSSGIDAPTNQLSPEQLGMRPREDPDDGRREPDDVADLATARPRGKVPRRASLQVRRFDPWSVLKLALVLGVALFFVWMFAVGVLYAVLDGMGVWAQLNGTYQDLTSDTGGGGGDLITAGGVFGIAAIIGVVNIILFTALASVSAFIYNISADVAGGIEVTLSERE